MTQVLNTTNMGGFSRLQFWLGDFTVNTDVWHVGVFWVHVLHLLYIYVTNLNFTLADLR